MTFSLPPPFSVLKLNIYVAVVVVVAATKTGENRNKVRFYISFAPCGGIGGEGGKPVSTGFYFLPLLHSCSERLYFIGY